MRLTKAAGILGCAILILGLTMYVSPLILPSIAPVRGTTRTISLVGNYPNWNISNPNPPITVTKGDTITINLSSADVPHQLLIDFDSNYTGGTDCTTVVDQCSKTFSPSTPTQLGPFTVTSNVGTYKYYCTIHYPSMQGLFIVQNPPAPDFGIATNPSSLSILQGSNANSTITVSSINNFAGTINLSASAYPSRPTTSFHKPADSFCRRYSHLEANNLNTSNDPCRGLQHYSNRDKQLGITLSHCNNRRDSNKTRLFLQPQPIITDHCHGLIRHHFYHSN